MQVERNVMINKAGGNAGKESVNYRVSIPADFIRGLGVTADDKTVVLKFIDNKIIITKK